MDTLRERARLLDMSFKQVVNGTLRRGLSPAYQVVPNHNTFVPGIDLLQLRQINDPLETEAFGLPRAVTVPDINLPVYAYNLMT